MIRLLDTGTTSTHAAPTLKCDVRWNLRYLRFLRAMVRRLNYAMALLIFAMDGLRALRGEKYRVH